MAAVDAAPHARRAGIEEPMPSLDAGTESVGALPIASTPARRSADALLARIALARASGPLPAEAAEVLDAGYAALRERFASQPELALALMQWRSAEATGEAAEAGAERAEVDAESAERERRAAFRRAMKHARKASRRLPRWVRRMISAVVSVAGAAGAAFSGGATAGLAIAGAVLLLASEYAPAVVEKLGGSERLARGFQIGMQIAGAALSLGASGAASAAASAGEAARSVADTAKLVTDVVEAAGTAVTSGDDLRVAGLSIALARDETAADGAGLRRDHARHDAGAAIDALREALARQQRALEAASAGAEARRRAEDDVIRALHA